MQDIVFKNVTKKFKNITALNNISFEINKDETVLFVGTNGSGKSTTIKLIQKMIFLNKYDSGEIKINNLKIGYMPEKVVIPKMLKVKEYLKDYYEIKESGFDYLELAKYFDLDCNKNLGELSKGMKQKVGLILALDPNNDFYILDEATNGLDDESVKKLVEKLKELKMKGKGMIIVSHYKKIYEELCGRKITFEHSSISKDEYM